MYLWPEVGKWKMTGKSLPRRKVSKIIYNDAGILGSLILGDQQIIPNLPKSAHETLGKFSFIYSFVRWDW